MTPVAIVRNVWTTRRGMGMTIAALVAGIALLLYSLADSAHVHIVEYGSAVIAPEKPAYCPGDAMRYEQHFVVYPSELPAILDVSEAWHNAATGLTLRATATDYRIPLVRPSDLTATVSRTVPYLPPGVYWLDHVAVNGERTGYTVGPVEVLFCGE